MVALPSVPAVASPILLPSLSNNSTVEPGSAVTSTGVLVPALPVRSVDTTGLLGFAGVVVSLSTLISFQPTGLEYLPSTMFAIALALPSLTGSFISRTIVSVNPSVAYDFTTAFDSSFAYHGPSIESRLRATSPALLVSLFV